MAVSHGAVGWSAVCNCDISWSYSLFVPERGTTDAIIVVWQMQEKCRAVNKHINMAFLALEKAFICVLRILMWLELRKLCYPGSEHQCHVCVVYGYSQEFTMHFGVSYCSGAQSSALHHCAGGIVTCVTLWSSVGGYLCRSSCHHYWITGGICQEALDIEKKPLRGLGQMHMMFSRGLDLLQSSGGFPCDVCPKGVGNSSIHCT